MGYLVIVPLLSILWGSLHDAPAGVPGDLTLDNYRAAFTSPRFALSLWNTAVFGVASTLLAVGMGGYLAWVTERTNAPGRRIIYTFVLMPIVVPSILTTIAWALMLHDRIGIANAALSALIGTDVAPFDAFTMSAMVWADATDSITLPFLLLAATFRTMDPTLEDASTIAGASHGTTLRRVTLPMMLPAVLATFLIVFIKTIDSFDVPAVLGLPAGIRVLATDVFLAAQRFPTDTNMAATFAMVYLAVAIVGLFLYHRATRHSERFVTISGRGYRQDRIRLGTWERVHSGIALTILGAAVILPVLVMAYASMLPFYTPPTTAVWENLGLDNYRFVLFESPAVMRAVRNNLVAGGVAALVAVLLATVISWVVVRTRWRWRQVLDMLAFAPIAIPAIVIALALMWFYLRVPLPIYASLWIITIAYVTAYLPYALRATHASLTQLSPELEEASHMSGGTWWQSLTRVVLPLIAPGLVVGFIYVFSRTLKVLSIPALLSGPGTEVLPVLIFDLYESGRYPELNALGILLFLFLLVVSLIAHVASRRARRPSPVRPPSLSDAVRAAPTGEDRT